MIIKKIIIPIIFFISPTFVAKVGTPDAIASKRTKGELSEFEDIMLMSKALISFCGNFVSP